MENFQQIEENERSLFKPKKNKKNKKRVNKWAS